MGRRWGKTIMAGACALAWANSCGHAVAWVVPTYKNARAPWRFAERACRQIVRQVDILKGERTIRFPSGGWLGIYTADNPVGILGESFDAVIVDEAARIPEEVWSEALLPTLADRDGVAMLISTPKGRNWFWREWMQGHAGEPGYAAWQAPSCANPIPSIRRAADLARQRVSERTYRQEWLAEFLEDGGGVFRGVRACVGEIKRSEQPCVIGVDWGRSHDFTVLAAVDPQTRALVEVDRFTGVEYAQASNRLRALWERTGRGPITAEANSMGGPIIEQLQRGGMPVYPFVTTNASKAQIVDGLALAFERQAIVLPDLPWLVAELEAFEAERLPSGLIRYSAPEQMHDDGVMALAIAYASVGRPSAAGMVDYL